MEVLEITETSINNGIEFLTIRFLAFDFIKLVADEITILDGDGPINFDNPFLHKLPVIHTSARSRIAVLAGQVQQVLVVLHELVLMHFDGKQHLGFLLFAQ